VRAAEKEEGVNLDFLKELPMVESARFLAGDRVRKVAGYPYAGTVVAAFTTLDGNVRYVVESDHYRGMLMIYSQNNLERLPKEAT
jgi:hypothetical protein